MKKLIALLLALVMVVGVLAGCNDTKPEETKNNETKPVNDTKPVDTQPAGPTESETPLQIHWDQGIGVDTLFENPYQNDSLMYATFMIWDRPGSWNDQTKEWELHVASDWGHNEDNTLYWFSIRDDVKWHDGEPVTLEDAKWSVDQALLNTGNTAGHSVFKYVEGYDACRNGEKSTNHANLQIIF